MLSTARCTKLTTTAPCARRRGTATLARRGTSPTRRRRGCSGEHLKRDVDLGAVGNVSNATTTRPRFTLQPLNLTAIMLDTAPIIDVVHEPFQHAVCRPPDTCLSCPRALPSDGMTQCSIYANRGQWQLLFARGSLLTRDKDLL